MAKFDIRGINEMEVNLDLRSRILEYSLLIEKSVNDLLLIYLGIYFKKKTRLFDNRPGISFKNKIDLLFDLEILSKEENYDFELLMIFRNKFLHDIECNSFKIIFEKFDNSIKKKFQNYLDKGELIEDELACENALGNLYVKNLKVLDAKLELKKLEIHKTLELVHFYHDQFNSSIDLFFDFNNDLISFINKNFNEKRDAILINNFIKLIKHYISKYPNINVINPINNVKFEHISNPDFQRKLFNTFDDLKTKIEKTRKKLNSESSKSSMRKNNTRLAD